MILEVVDRQHEVLAALPKYKQSTCQSTTGSDCDRLQMPLESHST